MSRRKVLFSYEMRKMIPFLILGLIAAAGASVILTQQFDETFWQIREGYGSLYLEDVSAYPGGAVITYMIRGMLVWIVTMCVPGFFVMSLVQFKDLHGKTSTEYLSSLPFTQNEKFMMKTGISYGMITLCCLIVSISALALRAKYAGMIARYNALFPPTVFRQLAGSDTTWHTVRVLLLFWLTLIAMYTVYMMCAYLIRSTLFSALIGVGTLCYPMFINFLLGAIVTAPGTWTYGEQYSVYRVVYHWVEIAGRYTKIFFGSALGYVRWASWDSMDFDDLGMVVFPSGYTVNGEELLGENTVTMSYGRTGVLFLLLIGILGICFFLAWRDSEKQDLTRINRKIPTRIGRIGIGLAISVGLSGTILAILNCAVVDNTTWSPSILLLLALWLIGAVLIYGIFHFITTRKRR